MVRSIDENDFDRRFPKGFGRSQTTETTTDDHHSRRVRRLLIRTIDRIEISIVHSSVSQAFEARNFRESCFLADRDGQVSGEQTAALSSEPETDKKNQDKRGNSEVRNRDDFDPHFANGRNVVVDIRIAVKEPVTIAKDVCAE